MGLSIMNHHNWQQLPKYGRCLSYNRENTSASTFILLFHPTLAHFSGSIPKHIAPLFRYQFLSFSPKAQATPVSYSVFPEKRTILTIYLYKYY